MKMPATITIATCVVALAATPCGARASDGCSSGCVTVSGANLLRDGKAWVPKGVQLVGFVAPPSALKGGYVAAHEHFGQAEMDAAKSYGADLIRFQVSHPGLDTGSPLYSAPYLDSLASAVSLARKNGFSVILSAQDQPPSGETKPRPLPDDATVAVWQRLATRFSSDTGVMFELFNEPFKVPNPRNWGLWQDSMQRTLDGIRTKGAHNVVIADGLGMGHNLENAPLLNDPTGQTAYAVHPYLWKFYTAPASWDLHFGNFARSRVVIATEWNALAKNSNCTPDLPTIASDLLAYLRQHRIGIVGFAFDLKGTLIKDFWTPTDYDNFACGSPDKGAGQLLERYFHGG
jgi:endoglucanase